MWIVYSCKFNLKHHVLQYSLKTFSRHFVSVNQSHRIFSAMLFQNGLMSFGIFPIMFEKTNRGTNVTNESLLHVSAHPDKINCNWKISLTAKRHFRRWRVSHHLQVWFTGSFRLLELPFSIQADVENLWWISVCAAEWIYNIFRKHEKKKKKKGSNKIKFFLSLGITGLGHLKSPCRSFSVLTRGSASSGGFYLSSWTVCSPRLLSLSHPSRSSWPLRREPPCNTVCRASSHRRSGRGWGSAFKKTQSDQWESHVWSASFIQLRRELSAIYPLGTSNWL